MSATFKNARKKLSQHELRKIMSEHKTKLQKPVKKIDSPLAKYNDAGQLTCILCKSVVRSEAVWSIHVNAKQHKENVELAKKLKERTNNFSTVPKRPLTPPLEVPVKKLKSILKNASPTTSSETATKKDSNALPEDFFDGKSINGVQSVKLQQHEQKMEVDEPSTNEVLPEGFFDDPKLDAKARHIEYKDPVEEEWEKFQKAIREADNISAAIIAEDQEEATNERQLDEIDEQMKNWSRVLSLEKKKVEINSSVTNKDVNMTEVDQSSSADEEEFDEYFDWRSKKSFK